MFLHEALTVRYMVSQSSATQTKPEETVTKEIKLQPEFNEETDDTR